MMIARIPTTLTLLLLAVGMTISSARAQMSVNPLDFEYDKPRIGGDLGLSSVWQDGVYRTGCGEFLEGASLSPVIALAYDRPLATGLRFEGLLGYQGRGLKSTYNSRENTVLRTAEGSVRADIDYENIGTASFAYIFMLPSIKFYPTKSLFVGAGLNAALLINAKTQYTKTILSRTVTVPELHLAEVYYPEEESSDPYSKVYEEEVRDDASGFGLDAVAYAGIEFPVSKKIDLAPRVLFTLPVTKVFTQPDLGLFSLQFLVGVRYNLN